MGAPYIYDISRLKFNYLTLILLTWRKLWAPNNASKHHMGFNSVFKGLKRTDNVLLRNIEVRFCNHCCSGKWISIILDFKMSLFSECCILSFGWFSGFWIFMSRLFRNTLFHGWNRVFQNLGVWNSDAGESPKRKNTKSILYSERVFVALFIKHAMLMR